MPLVELFIIVKIWKQLRSYKELSLEATQRSISGPGCFLGTSAYPEVGSPGRPELVTAMPNDAGGTTALPAHVGKGSVFLDSGRRGTGLRTTPPRRFLSGLCNPPSAAPRPRRPGPAQPLAWYFLHVQQRARLPVLPPPAPHPPPRPAAEGRGGPSNRLGPVRASDTRELKLKE